MENTPDILIVDDVPNAASDFAELIRAKYKFNILTADNPEDAIRIIKSNSIKVVVLDQKMPQMSGTELFKEIKKINPYVKALMLSGEAEGRDVGEAHEIGYERYLEKTHIKQLPETVFDLYTKFEVDFAQKIKLETCPIILSEKNFFSLHKIDFHLFGLEILNENYIFPDKWTTVLELHSGQSIEFEEKYQLEETITLNEETSYKITSEFNLSESKFNLLKVKINDEISNKFSITRSQKKVIEERKKVTYSLPAQTSGNEQPNIAKRVIETAPVYIEFRGMIYKKCSYCKTIQPINIIFYKQSKKFASRQTNYWSNGKVETISTGINQYFS